MTATDLQRCTDFFALAFDSGSHLAKWICDTLHGSLGQRRIAEELSGKTLSGKNAAKKAGGGAGVAAINRMCRSLKLRTLASNGELYQSNALDLLEGLHFGTECLHGLHGAKAVLTGQKAVDDGCSFGETGKHRGAMGYAFVSRDSDFGWDALEFSGFEGGHAKRICRFGCKAVGFMAHAGEHFNRLADSCFRQTVSGVHVLMKALCLLTASLWMLISAASGQIVSRFGTKGYVEHTPGDLPLVLCSPHGGRLKPSDIPNRLYGVTTEDANTQELTRAVAEELLRWVAIAPM